MQRLDDPPLRHRPRREHHRHDLRADRPRVRAVHLPAVRPVRGIAGSQVSNGEGRRGRSSARASSAG